MESLDDKIKRFLSIGSGSGYGSGSGSGYGSGYGSGDGDGIKSYNGETIYMIDGVKTLIEDVKGNFAKGWIVGGDLTLSRCWIARVGDSFAHGKDIHMAHIEALNKHLCDMPEEERIDSFVKAHPDMDCSYPGMDLFKWHNILTGSCEMGRKAFCADKGIDPETASFTVEEFIRLTCNSYGSSIIRQLADRLSIKL